MKEWDEFVSQFGKENIDRWIKPLKVLKFDACNLYLQASDSFAVNWFEEHVRHRLPTFLNSNGHLIEVHLSQPQSSVKPRPTDSFSAIAPDPLHPHCTFPLFHESEENKVPFRLLQQLTQGEIPLASFNPIYIYGGKGTGKTHLLMGAAHLFRQKNLTVFFVNADTFTEHVVGAIRAGKMQEFRKAYRNIDILMVDDIHIFSRKAATQEEFFHTFNTLHTMGKQIILTANVPPKDLIEIEPRLISRFEWGLTLPLAKSDVPSILLKKAKALQVSLPEEVQQFLLETFGSNTKTLCSSLEALVLRAHMQNKPLTAAAELLHDLEQKVVTSPEAIVKAVADYFTIRPADILGKSQNRDASLPRQIAMYFCRIHIKMPFMKIGEFFSRDHSTVMTSIKGIEKELQDKSNSVSTAYDSIAKKLELAE